MVSVFVDRVACLVNGEAAAHRAKLTDVVSLAPASLEPELQSIVELAWAAERGGRLSTTSPETSEMSSSMVLVTRTIDM